MASLIARILLGLIFSVFGLNGFLHFIPQGPMPGGPASQYIAALTESHYVIFVFLCELFGGILLLINRYVPLALTVLAPVIVNIVLFHAFMAPSGLPLAIVVVILWLLTAHQHRGLFAGLLAQ
jgi:peptidoglycan biosynthesis protein MviN/MurJ (putative lipid II flippase)